MKRKNLFTLLVFIGLVTSIQLTFTMDAPKDATSEVDKMIEDDNPQKPIGFFARVKRGFEDMDEEVGSINLWNLCKIKDLLPYAIVSWCFHTRPKQTMAVLTGLLLYALFSTDEGKRWWNKMKQGAVKVAGLDEELAYVVEDAIKDDKVGSV